MMSEQTVQQNSVKIWKLRRNGKFRGSARRSAARWKLWTVLISAVKWLIFLIALVVAVNFLKRALITFLHTL